MLGKPAKMPPSITPTIPNVGIRRKASGRPNDSVSRLSFISVFVSPRPIRRLPMTRLPKITSRLLVTYKVKKRGAKVHFCPNKVLIMGSDRTITAIVAGTSSKAVYLTAVAKMSFSSCFSFCGLSFAKAGNSTVAIGNVKKVSSTAKLVAAR